VSVNAVLFLVDITVITEDMLAVRWGPAYVHIETNGLHGSGTKLFPFGLFVFVERGRACRCADLDDFRKEEAGRRRRGDLFNGFTASPEAERIRGHA
jgi:hypothetical protein